MPRPRCCRRISGRPGAVAFKPAGIPARELEEVVMTLDEFEAIRLADLESRYQDDAAARMGISRPTFGRLIDSARRKVADTLVHGKALRIEGGPVVSDSERCPRCESELDQDSNCPRCQESPTEQPTAGPPPCGRRGRHRHGQG